MTVFVCACECVVENLYIMPLPLLYSAGCLYDGRFHTLNYLFSVVIGWSNGYDWREAP